MTQTSKPTKGVLQQIPVSAIRPHPDNPRRDLGDLTELAASIKENGVLQNLTIVPYYSESIGYASDDTYRCVIGHRRLAAAMMAGLETVPCVIVDMTVNQQRITMFTENMQRTDLTIWEQAHGFQTMLDLGDSVASLALKTGLSESTVRRRVRLMELDSKAFEKAEERGATIKDYMELDKIEDLDLKNKVLAAIGTRNFEYELQKAIDSETRIRDRAGWIAFLSEFATELKFSYSDHKQIAYFRTGNAPGEDVEIPDDADTTAYYYEIDAWGGGRLFRAKEEGDSTATESAISQEEQERRERIAQLQNIAELADQTRDTFVRFYPQNLAKKNIKHILGFLLANMLHGDWVNCDVADFADAMEITLEENDNTITGAELVATALEKSLERNLLALAWSTRDGRSISYKDWQGQHCENEDLDAAYDFLDALGYKLSDEEQQFKDGSHPLYTQPAVAASDDKKKQDACRVCGCTEDNACEGGCYWVEPDLCSQCAEAVDGEDDADD